jgi:hypothetical protein
MINCYPSDAGNLKGKSGMHGQTTARPDPPDTSNGTTGFRDSAFKKKGPSMKPLGSTIESSSTS